MNEELYNIEDLLYAYRHRQVGRVAWELCRLNAALEDLKCQPPTKPEAALTYRKSNTDFSVRSEDI